MTTFVNKVMEHKVGDEITVYPGWIEGQENASSVSFNRVLKQEDLCERNRTVIHKNNLTIYATGYMEKERLWLHIRDVSFAPKAVIEFIEKAKTIAGGSSYTFTVDSLRNCTLYKAKINLA